MNIDQIIEQRYSPRKFTGQSISEEDLMQIFDAARRVASAFNEQPWAFVYAFKEDGETFQNIASVLNEGNAWAKESAILILCFAKKAFDKNGKPNRHYMHDVGQAVSQMTLKAVSLGIYVHQMAGFNRELAMSISDASEQYEAVTAIALGYPDQAEKAEKTQSPIKRNSIDSFAFKGVWKKQ